MKRFFTALLFLAVSVFSKVNSQVSTDQDSLRKITLSGFATTEIFTAAKDQDNGSYLVSSFSHISLTGDIRPSKGIRAFTDIRLKYGQEFGDEIRFAGFREAFVSYSGRKGEILFGKKVLKTGKADFTNSTSKYTAVDYVSRSIDRKDIYTGNMLLMARWSPSKTADFRGIFLPYSSTSRLIIEPLEMPSYVTIEHPGKEFSGSSSPGYGFLADFHFRGIDIGLSWFDGYDPMPGLSMKKFYANLTLPVPEISLTIGLQPYRTRVAGIDFEAAAGPVGLRGEVAFSMPYDNAKLVEYAPLRQLNITGGIDYTSEKISLSAEYGLTWLPDFFESPVAPMGNKEPDFQQLAQLLMTPGFDLGEYTRLQIAAFNRLCLNQLDEINHTISVRSEADLFYGRLKPSLTMMYNVTTKDLLVMPEIAFKPLDALTFTIGAEYYNGPESSMFDLIDELLSTVYAGIRIDF